MVAIRFGIVLLMVAMGMETTPAALLRLWRHPRLLAGALLAAFVVVPLVAYGLVRLLPLAVGAKAGLLAVALTPGAPMIYRAASKRGVGDAGLAASFQVTVALLVIVIAPAWLELLSWVTGRDYGIPPGVMFAQVATIQFIPVLAGMALHGWRPDVTARITPTLVKVAQIALVVLIVILLIALGPRIVAAVHASLIVAAVLLAATALISAHVLAAPDPAHRLTLADANVQRNPGLALTLTAWSIPEQQAMATVAVVVYMIAAIAMATLYTGIYAKWTGLLDPRNGSGHFRNSR